MNKTDLSNWATNESLGTLLLSKEKTLTENVGVGTSDINTLVLIKLISTYQHFQKFSIQFDQIKNTVEVQILLEMKN